MKNTFFEKTPLLQKGSAPKDSDMMSFYDDEAYFDNFRYDSGEAFSEWLERIEEMNLPEDVRDCIDENELQLWTEDQYQSSVRLTAFFELDRMWDSAEDFGKSLPEVGGINNALVAAVKQKIGDMFVYIAKKDFAAKELGQLDNTDEGQEAQRLLQAQRDLSFMLESGSMCLNLGQQNPEPSYGTNAWYTRGVKDRDGGFRSEYEVCNDRFDYDKDDHAKQIEKLEADDSEGYNYPDEFHFPGKFEVIDNPLARVEFLYTPEAETAQARHSSHSQRTDSGKTREYANNGISMRIDLDPTAPYGIALDIARSEYDGVKNGGHVKRTADLLGDIFTEASTHGSHEYTGFTADMRGHFKEFAEELGLTLHLQKQELAFQDDERLKGLRNREENKLGRAELAKFMASIALGDDSNNHKKAA